MKKVGVNLVRGLLALVLGTVLLWALWQLAARALLHQRLPFVFGYAPLTVLSGSMEPAFSAGDVVVIRREAAYGVGDVVAFWQKDALTTHRITAREPEGFITQGDFNNAPDPQPVTPGQIAGRVVLVIPWLGRALLFLRTPPGLLCFLALGAALLWLPGRKKKT